MSRVTDQLLESVIEWASTREEIVGVAWAGSHARGDARPDSDVDLMLLTTRAQKLLEEQAWISRFGTVMRSQIETWGRVTSLRVWYDAGLEVEFSLGAPAWADDPDDGTRRVVRDGFRILWDPMGLFAALVASCAR
jgi:uncharacterized protein